MDSNTSLDIPNEYDQMLKQLPDGVIKEIYSKLSLKYYCCDESDEKSSDIEKTLLKQLEDCKFITYHLVTNNGIRFNAVICFEGENVNEKTNYGSYECIIIEKIKENSIRKIISTLQDRKRAIIQYKLFDTTNGEEQEEICSFYKYNKKIIDENVFVHYTLPSIIGYLIRRYYIPTSYFKNQLFFDFETTNDSESKIIKYKISNFFNIIDNKEIDHLVKAIQDIKLNIKINEEIENEKVFYYLQKYGKPFNINQNKQRECCRFDKKDFIILRQFSNENITFSLVMHAKTFHIFMMKTFGEKTHNIQHEIDFCQQYHHTCITPFYGFVTNKNSTVGFIYKFMSHGNLQHYIDSKLDEIDPVYALYTIYRISKALIYFKQNRLIHRDIKPSNILLDNDLNPYLSDFDCVKKETSEETNDETEEKSINKETTNNIGSTLYTSPEQYRGEKISFSTDVYSFGLVIYFIYEKKHYRSPNESFNELEKDIILNPNNKLPARISDMFSKCVKSLPEKRIDICMINEIIKEEVKSNKIFSNINEPYFIQLLYDFNILDNKDPITLLSLIALAECNLFTKIEENDSYTYLKLGEYYEKGYGFKRNFKKARKYYEFSKEMNNNEALTHIGNLYYNGYGVKKDYDKAHKYYEIASNKNDSYAFLGLGNLYYNGYGVVRDYKEAKKMYEKSASYNNHEAYLCLGNLYENGHGVEQNYTKAKEYYELSAKQNNPEALFRLGNFYFLGYGGNIDQMMALKYYILAMSNNSVDAFNVFGNFYVIPSNDSESFLNLKIETIRILCETFACQHINYAEIDANISIQSSRYSRSIVLLDYGEIKYKNYGFDSSISNKSNTILLMGIYYYNGKNHLEKNYLKAKYFFELASSKDNAYAYLYLGDLYKNGHGVTKNYAKAKECYIKSYELGISEGYVRLGDLYLRGQGVNINYEKAKQYYELAAAQRNPDSFIKIGNLYFHGYGVSKDFIKAKEYYEKAEEQNDPDTLYKLGKLYLNGSGVEKDYTKAKEYFTKSKSHSSILYLGYLYEKGYGVEQNYIEAKRFYEQLFDSDILDMNVEDEDENVNDEKDHYMMIMGNFKGFCDSVPSKIKSEAILRVGNFYENGFGVEKNYSTAKNYYTFSSQDNNSNAFVKLGNLYYYEFLYRDDLRTKFNYESASQLNNSYAMYHLGIIYEKEKEYLKSKTYYEKSSNLKNSDGQFRLGRLYEKEEKNYNKSKFYYELSSKQNNSKALLKLWEYYYHGHAVKKDYLMAKDYLEYAAQNKNPKAYFLLGNIYSTSDIYEINIEKAIENYEKCINIKTGEKVELYNPYDKSSSYCFIHNKYTYQSYNNLGLIYLFHQNDTKKSWEYIKEAANNSYPFGKYLLGLLYYFYPNNQDDQDDQDYKNKNYFQKLLEASENHFALADYFIGYICEKNGDKNQSIHYYCKASNDENTKLLFHNHVCNDTSLEISKTFIICMTNLLLTVHFFLENDYCKSKEYFIRAFSNLKLKNDETSYQFHCTYGIENTHTIFLYLKKFILEFPLFNLNQKIEIDKPKIKEEEEINTQTNNLADVDVNNQKNQIHDEQFEHKKIYDKISLTKKFIFPGSNEPNFFNKNITILEDRKDTNSIYIYTSIDKIFDDIIKNEKIKSVFVDEINKIINLMKDIIHTSPYAILFGRISFEKNYQFHKSNNQQNNTNEPNKMDKNFYKGFSLDDI